MAETADPTLLVLGSGANGPVAFADHAIELIDSTFGATVQLVEITMLLFSPTAGGVAFPVMVIVSGDNSWAPSQKV